MDDYLAHEPESHQLHTESEKEYRKEQGWAVGDALTLDPLDHQHQAHYGADSEEYGANQPEEAKGLLGEFGQKEEGGDVQKASQVHARTIQSRVSIPRMLGDGNLLHSKTFTQG